MAKKQSRARLLVSRITEEGEVPEARWGAKETDWSRQAGSARVSTFADPGNIRLT
jgi:hypothetical protein